MNACWFTEAREILVVDIIPTDDFVTPFFGEFCRLLSTVKNIAPMQYFVALFCEELWPLSALEGQSCAAVPLGFISERPLQVRITILVQRELYSRATIPEHRPEVEGHRIHGVTFDLNIHSIREPRTE